MKRRNQTSFIHMSEAAGAVDTDKGLSMIGGLYTPSEFFNIGAINHHAWDVMNIFYTEANGKWALTDEFALKVSGQYTRQKSIGNELTGDIDTGVIGTRAALSYKNAILNLAYTSTDDEQRIRSPYGGYPGYISLMISDFNRAGEDAWLVGLSYNFSRFGLDELSGFINYANSDTPDNGTSASPDQQEFDITLDYVFDTPALDGLWIRARAAHLDQDGAGAIDVDDYRVILNYSLALH